jgi:hypothetical protein
MPDGITPEASDFDPAAFFQGIRESIQNHVHDVGSLFNAGDLPFQLMR